jgi:hypothetical protein
MAPGGRKPRLYPERGAIWLSRLLLRRARLLNFLGDHLLQLSAAAE